MALQLERYERLRAELVDRHARSALNRSSEPNAPPTSEQFKDMALLSETHMHESLAAIDPMNQQRKQHAAMAPQTQELEKQQQQVNRAMTI